MLRQRVITAVVLLALLLPALFAPSPLPFALFTGVLISAAGWEWARLNGCNSAVLAVASGAAAGLRCAASACCACRPWGRPVGCGMSACWPGPSAARWCCGPGLRAGPGGRRCCAGRWVWVCCGWPGWRWRRRAPSASISCCRCCAWCGPPTSAAYFCGRAFGRNKLAPTISPGKSWEGVYGGVAGVLLLALGWIALEGQFNLGSASVFKLLQQTLGWGGLLLAALLLAALSVVGDLFESLVKRAAGAKDSSALLPGHGGVLDRVDALLPVLPAALALISLKPLW